GVIPVTENPTTTTVTNAQLQAMIDQGVTAALVARDANTNGDDSHTSGTGVRRNEHAARECTYPNFLKCKPLNFKGTKGVVPQVYGLKRIVLGSVTTWGNLVEKFIQKFYQLSDDNEEIEADEDDDPDDIAKIFKIKGNLFDNETPLCKAFNEFNYLLKIDTDLFTFDIQGIKTYEEYELKNNTIRDLEEPWSDNGLKEESLMHKAILEESWGDATPEVMTFYAWLKNSFENFHELDYEVLLKLEECRWKVNSHENAPFTRWENHGQGPYANAKTKMAYDPYLDINRIFGRNYEANNTSNTQDNQEYKKENHDPLVCNVRRFKMMKYSFDAEDEYVAIKEHEHSDHSRTNVDACQVYREIFRIMDEGWLMTKAKEE
ncbi:hypothetical protein Tco_0848346, partial [Tanacetum coccineum]